MCIRDRAVPRLLAIWEKYVSEKPRPGYRPLGLSYSAQGTYKGEQFLDAEQITQNKLYICLLYTSCNGRFRDWDPGIWYYVLDILNVMPLTEPTDSLTNCTDREPNKIYTQIDRLW